MAHVGLWIATRFMRLISRTTTVAIVVRRASLALLLVPVLQDVLNVLQNLKTDIVAEANTLLGSTDDGFVEVLKHSLDLFL